MLLRLYGREMTFFFFLLEILSVFLPIFLPQYLGWPFTVSVSRLLFNISEPVILHEAYHYQSMLPWLLL